MFRNRVILVWTSTHWSLLPSIFIYNLTLINTQVSYAVHSEFLISCQNCRCFALNTQLLLLSWTKTEHWYWYSSVCVCVGNINISNVFLYVCLFLIDMIEISSYFRIETFPNLNDWIDTGNRLKGVGVEFWIWFFDNFSDSVENKYARKNLTSQEAGRMKCHSVQERRLAPIDVTDNLVNSNKFLVSCLGCNSPESGCLYKNSLFILFHNNWSTRHCPCFILF